MIPTQKKPEGGQSSKGINLRETETTPPMSPFINSEVCQKCANCCKMWWLYTELKDDALRASWLDTDKISIIKIKDDLWKITFHIPCKMLIEKDGKFYCKHHKGERPDYCRTYPTNFKGEIKEVIEIESKLCPIIKEVI